MRLAKILTTLLVLSAFLWGGIVLTRSDGASAHSVSVPRYKHVFVLVEENHGFSDIIGNPAAPNLNRLAQTYGLATNYYGAIHPSEGNYVAMIGGNSYGIVDDNPYYTHTITNSSLVDQLEGAGLTWKGYFQSMPNAGFTGVCYPLDCTGPLYASKHNGFLNFIHVQANAAELQKLVPITQLGQDLQDGQIPNFGFIVPDQCHDMHGAPPFCVAPGSPGSANDIALVSAADAYANSIVNQITSSSMWSKGENAIVITWDEGFDSGGCCDANPGGGLVPAIVITSHGPRGLKDGASYNHYALLATVEQAFGLGCLQFTCDTTQVTAMAPLFAVKKSTAARTSSPQSVPKVARCRHHLF